MLEANLAEGTPCTKHVQKLACETMNAPVADLASYPKTPTTKYSRYGITRDVTNECIALLPEVWLL
jgi:hypothetical protein